ncbi:hypothetical protein HYH03_004535 [Edaphochlamys debaryana]|uniref:Endoplasmic reticulum oxidoreductin 1 n=1 Tax=Edaphochlamys debaryana TaxID=47281 RepID=A0A835Y9B9_9CHLO|nr:hypothetical protein HYH03_004535 [Edaphochlamys debaryana]|eukprot:KAG2497377.1 hypothetical protein HYH03_004535 [Edaphochlamys debaryana]
MARAGQRRLQAAWAVVACLLAALQPALPSNLTGISTEALNSAAVADGFATNTGLAPEQGPTTIPADQLAQAGLATCQLSGHVDDCCNCTYQDVDSLNAALNPLLRQLVRTAFFRYFKVNIYCDCPLWPDDSMCALRACSVCECERREVPEPWRQDEEEGFCNANTCAAEQDGAVDRTVDPATALRLLNLKGWRGFNNPWMAENEGPEEYLYVNLLINPERYTGYAGEHAHRIWNAIYNQSCFHTPGGPSRPAGSSASDASPPAPASPAPSTTGGEDGWCPEKRIFYRLISGMHTSISAHISANYLLDEDKGLWGHNLTDFKMRIGTPELRYRVENLYFAYLFVLRAVMKASPLLARYEYVTGLSEEDEQTSQMVRKLVTLPELASACPMPFDEGRLWKGRDGSLLREELRGAFVNITRVMDCVGCEKCKLWGKLQTLGVATALKVLFSSSDCEGALPTAPALSTLALERNEVIALVNLLERFSNSIEYYRVLSAELQAAEGAEKAPLAVGREEPVA